MREKPRNRRFVSAVQMLLAILFWLLVWQVASMLVQESLFLPSPAGVLVALWRLVPTAAFWHAVGASLARIAMGFGLGLFVGCALGGLSAAFRPVEILFAPLLQLVRATPVASFIILALVWIQSRGLSTFVSFLIVLPVIYNATLMGIRGADEKLLEMARVFRMRPWRRFRGIWLPALRAPLLAACEVGLGMCWKSGVAAEVIGLPSGTIGERLYQAKIFFQTPELFAWTVVIILFSWLFGRVVLAVLKRAAMAVQGGAKDG